MLFVMFGCSSGSKLMQSLPQQNNFNGISFLDAGSGFIQCLKYLNEKGANFPGLELSLG